MSALPHRRRPTGRPGPLAAAAALVAAAMLAAAAGTARAQGELDWVEVRMVVDGAGRAEVTYQTRWRTGGSMHGFYFQGAAATPRFTGGTAELPDGSVVPLAISPEGGRWDIVLAGGRAWGPGEATYTFTYQADLTAAGRVDATESAEGEALAVLGWAPVEWDEALEHETLTVVFASVPAPRPGDRLPLPLRRRPRQARLSTARRPRPPPSRGRAGRAGHRTRRRRRRQLPGRPPARRYPRRLAHRARAHPRDRRGGAGRGAGGVGGQPVRRLRAGGAGAMIGPLARRLVRRSSRSPAAPRTAPLDGPIPVELSPGQPHPIDLRWVDELMASSRPHLMVRPEDELLILVPNTPVKVNATALRILAAMVDEEVSIAEVLAREGDGPARRREIHAFFTDLAAWLAGTLGDGEGRRAVVHEPFTAEFCRYPVLAEVALTYRCNLTCAFCYAGCAAAGLPAGWSEERAMTDDEVCLVLDRIRRDARCPSVSFTGGEPTVRPGLPRLVAHAKGLGLKVNLISNGQLLGDRLAGALADAGLDSAQLSLEGPDAEVHDALVGRRGAFARLWAAAGRLRRRGVRVHTNTTVNRRNLPHLPAIVDLVADRGLPRLSMNLVIPCGSAGGAPGLAVPYSEAGEHVLSVRRRAAERGVDLIWYSPLPLCLFNTVAHGLGNRGCAAADGLLHVNPAGDVLPCSSFHHGESLGNLLRQPFEEIWRSRAARFFRAKRMMPPGCRGCPDAAVCQGACVLYWRGVGFAELGGPASGRPPLPEGFAAG